MLTIEMESSAAVQERKVVILVILPILMCPISTLFCSLRLYIAASTGVSMDSSVQRGVRTCQIPIKFAVELHAGHQATERTSYNAVY